MNGKQKRDNGGQRLKIWIFLLIVIVAGYVFWNLRDVPAEFQFSSPFESFMQKKEVSILIVGDIMLDRNVKNTIDKTGFENFFKGVRGIISDADIAVGNLEGPFTPYPSVTTSLINKELRFTFDPTFAPYLTDLGFDILGLANNHTLNFGRQGLATTKQYVTNAGMLYYGDPDNENEISVVTEKNGIKIGFVGFHEFNYINYEKVFAEIEALRPEVDVLIVNPHWGIEYQTQPTEKMTKWAHEFIDSGADAVIGGHPHVVGESEVYRGKKIYYSLGNFAFDQYFSEATMKGLAVKIILQKDSKNKLNISYIEIPLVINRNGVSI